MIDSMVNCLIIKPINQPRFQRRGSLVAYAWVKTRRSGLSKDKIAEFLNNTQPHSKIVNFYAVLSPSWPAKTSVSPRYSPLGTFRAEERLRLRARQKFHANDVKSVRTEALIGRRSSYIVLAIVCMRMTDKRQKATKVKCNTKNL